MMPLLTGVRVLGIEHCGAGAYGSQLPADLGAAVIARQLTGRNAA